MAYFGRFSAPDSSGFLIRCFPLFIYENSEPKTHWNRAETANIRHEVSRRPKHVCKFPHKLLQFTSLRQRIVTFKLQRHVAHEGLINAPETWATCKKTKYPTVLNCTPELNAGQKSQQRVTRATALCLNKLRQSVSPTSRQS